MEDRPGIGEGIPDSRFGRETGNPRFPIRPGTGIGVPIRRAGDFLVCSEGRLSCNEAKQTGTRRACIEEHPTARRG